MKSTLLGGGLDALVLALVLGFTGRAAEPPSSSSSFTFAPSSAMSVLLEESTSIGMVGATGGGCVDTVAVVLDIMVGLMRRWGLDWSSPVP